MATGHVASGGRELISEQKDDFFLLLPTSVHRIACKRTSEPEVLPLAGPCWWDAGMEYRRRKY